MKVVPARVVALACAVLAVVTLTACQSKSGAAAVVDGQRISESDVADLVSANAPNATQSRQFALVYLVKEKLYGAILTRRGGIPSNATLTGYHDEAVSQILSSQLGTGAAADGLISKVLVTRGISTKLTPVIVRSVELEWALFQNLKVVGTGFFAAVAKFKVPVSISPRYGSWDPTRQDLVDPVTPSFLTLSPSAVPSTDATPATSPAPATSSTP